MNTSRLFTLAAAAAVAASCAKEEYTGNSSEIIMEPMSIEAAAYPGTRTALDGKEVIWTEGDRIAVYSDIDLSTGYIFAAEGINGSSARFSGEVPSGTGHFFAVYPPERVVSASAEGVTVNIPADQTPAEGSFAEEMNVSLAEGTKTPGLEDVGTLTFENLCSYVKFTVPAYVEDVSSVKISSAGPLAGDFSSGSSSIVANGSNSITMNGSFGAGKTFIFVIAPGTVSNFSIEITGSKGSWTRTVSKGFSAKAGTPVNLGTVDFKQAELSATASHVYDGATLVGTDLDVDLHLDGFTNYASDLRFDVKKAGSTVRSYSSASLADSKVSLSGTSYTDYPYLPQGEYTIEGSYTRPDGSTQSISGSFTVPAPTFRVNAPVATTSYDTYLNSGAAAANAQDGSTIYGIAGNGVSISEAILTKYASLTGGYSFTIDGNAASAGDNANQTWAAHEVVAKYTFDGVSVSSDALVCHVTGLPYTLQPTKGDWAATVTSDYVYFNTGNIELKGNNATGLIKNPKIQSKSFHLPANVNVTSDFSYLISVGKFGIITYKSTLTMYMGGAKAYSYQRGSSGSETRNVSVSGTLSSSKPYLEFEAATTTSSNSDSYSRIYTVPVLYRNN